ncbi:bifunctional tRNA (5-methylaminomethyl-2-thiouridine)(34)-methyltransferase MnmD/FAD-dependent 5-carboxymethylaminomethyl-2-thiouridine(34) oxidoreductase MnmC [Dongshaea marina]|uniref:bifunctional tRNA (5-methylaminomethyl-2-thiouridine)(34)-methyltransferase MnmD/FAD-dependent 5-carboxymethylaminomethyl-2-thiouridine(34) oxidoreductase MnmC n=1 Tax=Dongshaea marina TaxID=2047966 RepID=UPI000D3E93B8|nr:bifunctional tRNA (5-methylaminomethyl-2-thiouridine)(34)-methyltransferase MnmD/FAD-dependent 5-carboxymethylaminomethyl-2-thiouridine(34) oxidoreductase MnmC [Dongshaea marina]
MSKKQLAPAQIQWNERGTPVSDTFDDVYFSCDNGLAETQYVFLEQNELPERWSTHPHSQFVIGETGFGTGLNFLAAWQLFREYLKSSAHSQCQRLHFISVEKHPLARHDLEKALLSWPELSSLSEQLIARYPQAVPGCHRIIFDGGRATLDLWLGEALECFGDMATTSRGLVDCWFLDGFAPAKNPEMWQQPLFEKMALLSREKASCATFTAAGFVRRGLIEAGFNMRKVKGFGHKRDMLAGRLGQLKAAQTLAPCDQRAPSSASSFTVIGGGLASACTTLALTRRGKRVRLLCEGSELATGASGNRQGALYPLLNGEHDRLSQFYSLAFGYSHRLVETLAESYPIAHDWCGVTQLAYDAKSKAKLDKMREANFPDSLVKPLSVDETERLSGVELGVTGVSYPQGGWIYPKELTQALIAEAHKSGLLELRYNCRVTELMRHQEQWLLTTRDGEKLEAEAVIVAAGANCTDFSPLAELPVSPVRGQVSHLPTQPPIQDLKTVLCYQGYCTPTHQGSHCIGASFIRGERSVKFSLEEHQQNKQRLVDSLPALKWPSELDFSKPDGRAGLRCTSRDHLPLVGQATNYPELKERAKHLSPGKSAELQCYQPELYLIAALGSRGLCSAPLCGELLAAQLCGEPLPQSHQQLRELSPNRFWMRKLAKGAPLPA